MATSAGVALTCKNVHGALGILLALIMLCMTALLPAPALAAEAPVPVLTARVTDLTNTLGPEAQASLTQQLAGLEQRKGAQIAVLMVPGIGDDTIESYARRVYDQWQLGRKKIDDGILFVVAKNDRKVRIEVGYGLEGAVPDLLAGRIIREQVAPLFKQGNFAGGVAAGVDSLIKLVDGEALPAPKASATQTADDAGTPAGMLLPLAIMAFMMPAAMAAIAVALFTYFIFHSIWAALAGGILALILSAVGRKTRAGGRGTAARASRRGAILGGLGGYGLGGGFGRGGGGGFGGGGFGGGGGGSGGGGASGGW